MFSGIVAGTGEVIAVRPAAGAAFRLEVDLRALRRRPARGASVAVAGVCLTVAGLRGRVAAFDVVGETADRSTLGALRPGDLVNLEGSLRLGDEVGGHMVQGHVEGVGAVARVDRRSDGVRMTFRAPARILRSLVRKGCVAVDGVSLTVARLGARTFCVALIPETLRATTLGAARTGTRVNLEGDRYRAP